MDEQTKQLIDSLKNQIEELTRRVAELEKAQQEQADAWNLKTCAGF